MSKLSFEAFYQPYEQYRARCLYCDHKVIMFNAPDALGQLDKSKAEGEEAVARIQELEQQLLTVQVGGLQKYVEAF